MVFTAAIGRSITFGLALLLAAVLVPAGLSAPAYAQEKVERKSLLKLLFGKDEAQTQQAAPRARKSRSRPVRSSRPSNRAGNRKAAPAQPAAPKVEKLVNARKVLVVGDFLAGGLAEGLEKSFDNSPGVVIVSRTKGSSGLVRDDHYNWPKALPDILAEVDPDIVIVQIGSNDSQQMRVAGTRLEVRSPPWLEEYGRRTEAMIAAVKKIDRPLLWVGVPSFNFTSMTADMVAFNGIFKNKVEQVNGEFIDIWDGFVDEDGKFVFTGSDINGQQVRLRGPDGINMTAAGRRKMAFYTEKTIRRLLGSAADPAVSSVGLDDASLPDLTFPTSPLETINPVRTAPVAMLDPELDGGDALLDQATERVNLTPTPRDRLVEQGLPPEAPAGRADDFRWPRTATN
ncbi:SGNH/GDSL hydrolase family protein [Pseudohoeflea coraliihabitans]|uniref:DUF459 domain-containing protein n=1 Tax=Pseudohoeflea coraliihabitans TaxID=2860393 RepID=A0ABS6WK62_9HYPH|nr:DUF459 domain-containing protein [Pseudohoeflea sp. DP4N28-3]MBW3096334.1 DUF459 domain-containing protein [Pseudohoeflea sp. DP4N28-3]